MAFKASNSLPAKGYENAKSVALQAQQYCQQRVTAWASGTTSDAVLITIENLNVMKNRLDEIRTVPGIAAYARDQEDDQTYDVVAEFNALIAAIDAAITQMSSDMPKDGSGFILAYTLDANGVRVPRSFSGGAMANSIASLSAIVAAVS